MPDDDVLTRAREVCKWYQDDRFIPPSRRETGQALANLIALAEKQAAEIAETRGLHYNLTRIIESQGRQHATIRRATTSMPSPIADTILAILDGKQS